jgi:NAD(P)-dependent dehydrogenase (short-subunit alcohol dehydrogenase family)
VIISTASMAGLYPYKDDPVYAAAKAGVVNFTYSLAPWAARLNIRVNCVCPGVVDTPLVRKGWKLPGAGENPRDCLRGLYRRAKSPKPSWLSCLTIA